MDKLQFDSGVKQFECNGGAILSFNPTDQNVYARFIAFYQELPELSAEYDSIMAMNKDNPSGEDHEPNGEFGVALLAFDKKIKGKLADAFGPHNDFDAIFAGGNIMALTDTGRVALENFLDALFPVIETNADKRLKLMEDKAKAAKEKQAKNRAQRRAIK